MNKENTGHLGAEGWVLSKLDFLDWIDSKIDAVNSVGREHSKAYQSIESHYMVLERLLFEVLWNSDCEIACGLCCFFPDDESVMVPIEKERLSALKDHITSLGKKPEDYVKLRTLSEIHPQVRPKIGAGKASDFITQHAGVDMVYFLRTKPVFQITKARLKDVPPLRGGEPNWLDGSCRQCVFLEENLCSIYGSSSIPGSCKNFMCFTGFIINILGLWGLVSCKEKKKPLGILNKAAFEADKVFSSQKFTDLQQERESSFKRLVKSYLKGFGVTESLVDFEEFEDKYFTERKNMFKKPLSLLQS